MFSSVGIGFVNLKPHELHFCTTNSSFEKVKSFVDEQLEWLKKGNADIIIQNLCKLKNQEKDKLKFELIDSLLRYIENNKERMKYDLYKKKGYCIGSGAIESANKYVVQRRLKLAGMKWNQDNANFMVHLRAEYINKQMDAYYGIESNPLTNQIPTTKPAIS